MPGKKKTYTINKSDQVQKRRAQLAAKRAYAAQRGASSYLSEDEQLSSWKLQLNKIGLELRDIPADGNCLFGALADQLDGHTRKHLRYRAEVCQYMADKQDEFAPFIDDSDMTFDKYLSALRKPGTFAGNDALVAFARLKQVTIVVHQLDSASFSIDGCEDGQMPQAELHLTYHHGEHYSSVRKIGDRSSAPAKIRFSRSQNSVTGLAKLDQISQSTGCQNKELIAQSLKECGDDMNATIDYINSMSLADKTDSSSCGSGVSSYPHQAEMSRQASSITIDSGVGTSDSLSNQTDSSGSNQSDTLRTTQNKQKLTKSERKKEKKKRAELRRKAQKDVNHNETPADVYEVVPHVALLSV